MLFKKYDHPSGCTVTIFYVETPEKTFNLSIIWKEINELWQDNLKRNGNIFDGLKIEIYDCLLDSDIAIIKGGYAGLTYASSKLIQLRSDTIQTEKDCANCFSHEIGHWKAELRGYNNKSLEFTKKYINLITPYVTLATPMGEMIAENDRELEGCTGAKGYQRTDKYGYIQGSKIAGVKDLLFMWKSGQEYLTNNFNKLPDTLWWKKSQLTWILNGNDLSLSFSYDCLIPLFSTRFIINNSGIYMSGKCIKAFI